MNLFFIFLLSFSAIHFALPASVIKDEESIERIGFYFKDLQICHQLEWRNLTVSLEFETESGKAEDITNVKQFVRTFLDNYSNELDFWEIMNAKLVRGLVQEYPEIRTLKSILSLAPDRTLSFPRKSTIVYTHESPALKEFFGFTKLGYLICSETFDKLDLHVDFQVRDNPDPFDYPDYQWIDAAMDAFFETHPMSRTKWKELKPQLETLLLERFPTLTSMDINVTTAL